MACVSEQLAALETRLKALEEKEKTQVVFTALVEKGGAWGPFCTDQILVYNKVITNTGGAYCDNTGVFTAPVAGVYYFTIFYHAGGHQRTWLTLMKNDDPIVGTSDHKSGSDNADNGGNAAFVQLKKGDKVFVRMADNSHVWAADHRTSFSGFLISQM